MSPPAFVSVRPSEFPTLMQSDGGHGDPCTLLLFGATGDLTRRKLMPALYDLLRHKLLSSDFAVLGVDRVAHDDLSYRTLVREALSASDEVKGFDEALWEWLSARIFYVQGDLSDAHAYVVIRQKLESIEAARVSGVRNRMLYFAVPPSVFTSIIKGVSTSGIAPRTESVSVRPWVRVIVEKPFGTSLATAQALSRTVLEAFEEHQVFRIDHYLGKETVQNILVFRSANLIFEPLWNNKYIDSVQITAAETVGVEARGRYYEEAGVVRDMFQNHLFQLLTLTAMELPVTMNADAVRDEKVKVLHSIEPFLPDKHKVGVLAQYSSGTMRGVVVPGYRDEPNVSAQSRTPTYAALKVMVDNWRWKGVPFYLRSGKRMAKRVTEIAIRFRSPPHLLVGDPTRPHDGVIEPNVLVMRVQPNEGISLRFHVKVPGAALQLTPEIEVAGVDMDFAYSDAFGSHSFAAYGTLLLDCMLGDATLFARTDEVEAAWKLTDPLLEWWDRHLPNALPVYEAGSWGPQEADEFLATDGFSWRTP